MRQAPPVSVACPGGGGWRAVLISLPALTGAVVVAWAALWAGVATPGAAALAAITAVCVAASGWRRTRPVPAMLVWDGGRWLVDGAEGEVDVMLDFGAWLLLRWRGADRARWLAASRSTAVGTFHALRAALYARPGVAPRNV